MTNSAPTEFEKKEYHKIMNEIEQFIPRYYVEPVLEILKSKGLSRSKARIQNCRLRRAIDLDIAKAFRDIARIPEELAIQNEKKSIIVGLGLSQ